MVGAPVTRIAPVVAAPVVVWKTTWGTTTLVERIVVEELDGITDPAETPVVSVQGTTRVVYTLTVVTGTVVWTAAVVDTVEAQVTMAGLDGMYAAQIPWK